VIKGEMRSNASNEKWSLNNMSEQIFIAFFGVTAIFLSQSSNKKLVKYACLFGLASQPFWFYSAYQAEQWGILTLCCFYTLAWFKGVKTHWINA